MQKKNQKQQKQTPNGMQKNNKKRKIKENQKQQTGLLVQTMSGQGGEQGREERGENSGQFSAREAGNRRKLREGLRGAGGGGSSRER